MSDYGFVQGEDLRITEKMDMDLKLARSEKDSALAMQDSHANEVHQVDTFRTWQEKIRQVRIESVDNQYYAYLSTSNQESCVCHETVRENLHCCKLR